MNINMPGETMIQSGHAPAGAQHSRHGAAAQRHQSLRQQTASTDVASAASVSPRFQQADGSARLSRPVAYILPATQTPPAGLFGVLADGLRQSSFPATGPVNHQCLVVPLHDHDGQIVGGLWGCTLVGWLNIEMVFIPARLQRLGFGKTILAYAEAEARQRGCGGALVDTFDQGAAAFYERAGFTRFAELPNFPLGHRRMFYRKLLTD